MWNLSITLKLLTLFSVFVGLTNSIESSISFFNVKINCIFYNSNIAECRLIKIARKERTCEFDFESIFNVTTGFEKNDLCVIYEKNDDCPESHAKVLDSKFGFRIETSSDVMSCHQDPTFSRLIASNRLIQEHDKHCTQNVYQQCILKINYVKNNYENKPPHQNPQNIGSGTDEAGILSRNSVLFVAVSFILLMVISLAWLVFYYVQRFRYIHSKERVSRCLADLAKKAVARIPVKTLKPGDKEIGPEIDQCAICIEAYRALDNIRILPCRHFFHKQCIDPWLLEQRSCPMCKLDILHAYGLRPELGSCGNNGGHNNNNNSSNNQNSSHHPQGQLPHGHYNHQSTSPAHLNQAIQFLGNIQGSHHRQHRLHHHHHQTTTSNNHHSNGQIHLPSSIVPNAITTVTASNGAQGHHATGQSGGSPHSSSLPSLNAILDYHETLFPQAIPTVHQGTISQIQSTNQSHTSTTNMNVNKKNRIFFHKNPFDNSLIMSQSQHYYSHQGAAMGAVNGSQSATGPIVVVTSQGPSGNHLIQSINSEAFADVNEFSERISINQSRPTTFRERFSQNWRSIFSRRAGNNNQNSDRNMCLNSGYNLGQFEDITQSNERRRNRRQRRKNRKNLHNLLNNQNLEQDQTSASQFQYSIVAMQQAPQSSQSTNQQLNQITMMNNASSHLFNQDLAQISAFTTDSNGNRILCQNYPFLKQKSSPQLETIVSSASNQMAAAATPSQQSYQIITTPSPQNPFHHHSSSANHFENNDPSLETSAASGNLDRPELIVVIVENDKPSLNTTEETSERPPEEERLTNSPAAVVSNEKTCPDDPDEIIEQH